MELPRESQNPTEECINPGYRTIQDNDQREDHMQDIMDGWRDQLCSYVRAETQMMVGAGM